MCQTVSLYKTLSVLDLGPKYIYEKSSAQNKDPNTPTLQVFGSKLKEKTTKSCCAEHFLLKYLYGTVAYSGDIT